MKITREINGKTVEITLTDSELFRAYMEQEEQYDLADLGEFADIMEEDGETVIDRAKLPEAVQIYNKYYWNSTEIADIKQDLAFLALDTIRTEREGN